MTNTTSIRKAFPSIALRVPLLTFSLLGSTTASAGACVAYNSGEAGEPEIKSAIGLPLIEITDLIYQGAFKHGTATYGISNVNSSHAAMDVSNGTVFMEGHPNHDAVAQFNIPTLVKGTSNASLLNEATVLQPFSKVVDRADAPNVAGLNNINDIVVIDGELVVNSIVAYDAEGNTPETTVVINDPAYLAGSSATGYLELQGASRSAGWMTPIPSEWQAALDGDYIGGASSGDTSINSRHSMGPSAYAFYKADLFAATNASPEIPTKQYQNYTIPEPLYGDYAETLGSPAVKEDLEPNSYNLNPLFNKVSHAAFGMIVPGTSTYLTIGNFRGMEHGIGYKIIQDTGRQCGGYCGFVVADRANYYWLFDVNDWIRVKNGEISPSDIRPYSYGVFDTGFLERDGYPAVLGSGSWDESTNTLWVSLRRAAYAGSHSNPPVVAAYKFNHLN